MEPYGGYSTRQTPQSEPIPGSAQVPNSAGGYAWAVDDWVRLDRFLVLGSEGGSYYAEERKLTRENAEAVLRCVRADGPRTVRRIVEVSEGGRAPKNDPALFALAMAAGLGDEATRRAALEALPAVARIGTHLFHFAAYVEQFRGWGRLLRRAVASWYVDRSVDDLAYQLVKYQQRDGWSHRDLLRLASPTVSSLEQQTVFRWVVAPQQMGERAINRRNAQTKQPLYSAHYPALDEYSLPAIIKAFVAAQQTTSAATIVQLIRDFGLPRECIPTEHLNSLAVWEALLEDMPMTAMIRNLATMTRVGLISPMSAGTATVVERLADKERLRRARVHPIAVLAALKTYESGHGGRGQHTWQPVAQVVDALDAAFYASFGNVEPTNKRLLLALDVSGSMSSGAIAGVPGLTPRVGAAAMALVTAAVEPNHAFVGFFDRISPINISLRQWLDDVVGKIDSWDFGGTDCALPMIYALQNNLAIDGFVVYTDSETWFGSIHPAQALHQYRERTGIPAKLVVVGMVSNGFSIADPDDAGMMDVVGFDMAAPNIIADFVRGSAGAEI